MNYWRPNISTFDKIVDLLDQMESLERTKDLMISGGMAARTPAGARFFSGRLNESINVIRQLNQYPWEWVEGVRTVIEVRKQWNTKTK